MSVDETNPYSSPKSQVEPGALRRRRWRKLPAVILIMVGGIWVFSSAAVAGPMPLFGHWDGRVSSATVAVRILLMVIAGVIWIASGVAVWKGMWWRAALGIVVGYSLRAVASNFVLPGEFH